MRTDDAEMILDETRRLGRELVAAGCPVPTLAEAKKAVADLDRRLAVVSAPGYQPAPGELAPEVAIEVLQGLRRVAVAYVAQQARAIQ